MGPKTLYLRRAGCQFSSDVKLTNCLFRAVILTAWDNILGPSAVAHWNLELLAEDERANIRGPVNDDRFPLPGRSDLWFLAARSSHPSDHYSVFFLKRRKVLFHKVYHIEGF